MTIAETARMVVDLSLTGNFTKNLKTGEKALGSFGVKLDQTASRGYRAGQQIGTGIKNGVKIAAVALGTLGGLLVLSVHEGQQAAKTQEVYANSIKNSGKVSAAYVAQLNAQQKALEDLGGVDDELIKKQQTTLIQMGLTGKQVLELTPLILDASKATGKSIDTITVAVGKAVNGSTGGLAKLGIVIPKADKDLKGIAKTTADYAAVQQGLNSKFAGTTKALSGDFDVRLAALREHLADVREEAGMKLIPVLTRITDVVGTKLVPAFGKFIDAVLPDVISGLDKFASFLESGGATQALDSVLGAIKVIAPAVQRSAEITGQVITTAVSLFRSLPPEIQSLAVAGLAVNKLTGGLVTNLAGGLISAVISSFKGLMNVNAAVVNVNGPAGLPGVPGGGGVSGLASKVFLVGEAIGLAAIVTEIRNNVAQTSTDTAKTIQTESAKWLAQNPSKADLAKGLAGVEKGISDIESNPLNVLIQGDALDYLRNMKTDIGRQLARFNENGGVGNQSYGPFTQSGINKNGGVGTTGYGPWATLADALKSNTSAVRELTKEQRQEVIDADRAARGLTGKHGPSTSIAPRLQFLAGGHSGAKDVAVADALALGFERNKSPAFQSTAALKDAIKGVSRDIKTLPPKFTGPLKADLGRLKSELARRTEDATRKAADKTATAARLAAQKTTQAVKDKDLSVTVNAKTSTYLNGRLLNADLGRYSTVLTSNALAGNLRG